MEKIEIFVPEINGWMTDEEYDNYVAENSVD